MPHHTPLISTIVVALVLAFILGALANRFRISPLVGYLLAGVLIGPFTPGYVADQNLANDLAEIGIILLMFGVGLHFTLEDLLSVRAIAIPGAIAQIASRHGAGHGACLCPGLVDRRRPRVRPGAFGRQHRGPPARPAGTAADRDRARPHRGRLAGGRGFRDDPRPGAAAASWPASSRAPAAQGFGALVLPILITLGKVAAFVAVMLVIGKRVIPWVLHAVVHTGSRELFRLCVLAIALGVAFGASVLFDVSFALGAFFAGMILSESELSQRAAQETLPLRDAFAVLFFVSVGMLVDPTIVLREPLPLLVTVLIIVFGKSIAAFVIVRLFGYPTSHALTISASLAQIGEFSFILAGLGVSLALLPERARDLILAGAIISILLNPLLFALLDRYLAKHKPPALEPSGTGRRCAGRARQPRAHTPRPAQPIMSCWSATAASDASSPPTSRRSRCRFC